MAAAFRPVNSPAVPHHPRSDLVTSPSSAASSSSLPVAAQAPPFPTSQQPPAPASGIVPAPAPPSTVVPSSSSSSSPPLSLPQSQPPVMADDAKTPTRATFSSGSLAGQKPLPTSPFPQAVQVPDAKEGKSVPKRGNSQHSQKSKDSEDIEMEESEGDAQNKDENEGSDHESENADGKSSSKKKKSQRFYCTDYPPCTLSFTRSEHLARHIRKHTGERPFQCHCSRRFSRLDNLRQHAQTVHVNEDIPIDSLAATGTRFQRQAMRPERVRQVAGRARASTAGSATGVVRGHSKSLSTSSISSISSTMSARDRPPPLVMAADPRAKLTTESYGNARDNFYPPSDFSTPTSATFSTGQNSPRWSGYASPTSSHSRSQSMYTESRTPSRRLSVSTAGNNPFQAPAGANVGRPTFAPGTINTSNSGALSTANSSLLSSPTLPGSGYSRRDSVSSNGDEAWRRRTWHPDSQNFHPTRLSNVSTPGQYDASQSPPLAQPSNRASSIRLPGIESFDPIPHRPATPPKRGHSPMMVDSEASNPPPMLPSTASLTDERRNLSQWDMSLHRGLTRLEITPTSSASGSHPASNALQRDSAHAWANEANQAVQAQAEQVRLNPPPAVRFETATPSYSAGNAPVGPRSLHQHTMSAPNISAARDHRRHGWYNGPLQPYAEESRSTRIERMVHPNINGFSGFPARDNNAGPPQAGAERSEKPERHRGLDALVAVATGEGNTAAAY